MEFNREKAGKFGKHLMKWHERENRRELPWKETSNPYKIWLSEIMSQQTRLEHVISYYYKYIEEFPAVEDLAASTEDKVLSMWSGLGYYNRARNMYKAAQIIVEEYNGEFPRKYENIRNLPGIGEYTAAAIASFAYGDKKVVIDANVKRIYARYCAVGDKLSLKQPRERMREFLTTAMQRNDPAEFNQAIMDFGAQICTSKSPKCKACPLKNDCRAYEAASVSLFPIKKKRKERKKRMFHYFILEYEDKLYLRKRGENDIWRKMWEFPQIEYIDETTVNKDQIDDFLNAYKVDKYSVNEPSELYSQTLSHQKIKARFYKVDVNEVPESENITEISKDDLNNKAFPGIIREYLKGKYDFY